jgi:hypothetical protein
MKEIRPRSPTRQRNRARPSSARNLAHSIPALSMRGVTAGASSFHSLTTHPSPQDCAQLIQTESIKWVFEVSRARVVSARSIGDAL